QVRVPVPVGDRRGDLQVGVGDGVVGRVRPGGGRPAGGLEGDVPADHDRVDVPERVPLGVEGEVAGERQGAGPGGHAGDRVQPAGHRQAADRVVQVVQVDGARPLD